MTTKEKARERHTIQKDLVHETVMAMHNHPTAQEIFEKLHKAHPTVSRATVYRILGSLAEQHKILKIASTGGADCFDFNTSEHAHFLCRICNRIGDIQASAPSIPIPPETHDYQIESYSLLYHGICAACLAEGFKTFKSC